MSDLGNLFIALKVENASTSAEFYSTLGFTPEDGDRWTDDYACFEYRGTRIALMTFIPHTLLLNLEQPDLASLDALRERLKKDGLSCIPAGPEGNGLFLDDPHDGGGFTSSQKQANRALGVPERVDPGFFGWCCGKVGVKAGDADVVRHVLEK